MYKSILITLEATATDRAIIDHVKQLATSVGGAVALLHVATGVPAQFHGSSAAGQEIDEDQAYLASIAEEFASAGVACTTHLAFGDPVREILRWVEDHECDLVAMSTHGHRFLGDLLFGATASRVQHRLSVPVLLLRAK
jgi:nucleotide-binding universal stress UspA family protein